MAGSNLQTQKQAFPRLVAMVFILAILCPNGWTQSSSATTNFDGPAELPRIYLHSSLADTPAPGKTRLVQAGEDLQAALNHASCGDTLRLQAGATFTGTFHLPKKPCDDSHWIVIRTGAADSELPAEGVRLTPCYAGVASLPGRPDFHCSAVKNVLSRVTLPARTGAGPIVFAAGASHYRLIGLEITRDNSGASINALISAAAESPADHIILDRVWAHGTAQDETTRGAFLTGMRYVAVVDSFFTDFHCIARTGSCTDSQAIAGGAGDLPMGPWKIENDYLEASGENIIFGGAGATTTPADIEIRHNHFFKPFLWMPGHQGFIAGASGQPFIVKNLLEFKNAQRVLVEGNLLENVWGGVGQQGFAIVLTPKNQSPNVCPLCRVTDVTLRYNRVAHMGGGLMIANVLSDTKGASTAGERISVHDIVFEDIDGINYKGFGMFALIMSVSPKLHDVWLDHITAFPPRVLFGVGGTAGEPKITNFVLRNSIIGAGERQLTTTGGGPSNCASKQPSPEAVLNNCFQDISFTHNALVGGSGAWPKSNFFPASFGDVGFVNFNKGSGGDYHLCQGPKRTSSCKGASKYAKAGTDGKDLGADISAIEAATAGVQ